MATLRSISTRRVSKPAVIILALLLSATLDCHWGTTQREPVEETQGDGGGDDEEDSVGGQSYTGEGASECSHFLREVMPWSCPDDVESPTNQFSPPTALSQDCMRDSYVNAAIQYCWGAECYARLGQASKASDAAHLALGELTKADALCGDGPAVEPTVPCSTTGLYPCP